MRPLTPKRFLALQSLALLLIFVQNVLGLTVTRGPTVSTTDTTATIEWTTDVEAGTRVQYGTQEKLLDQRATGGVGKEHRIELSGLHAGTQYYFSIGSARTLLSQGGFQTTGGNPVSTPASAASPEGGVIKRFLASLLPEKAAESTGPAKTTTAPAAPPTRQTWCRLDTLEDHFERHGADFKSTSSDHYAAQAWRFLQHARQSALPMKWDAADRTLRVWEPKTRTFAAYDSRGRTRTFFRPSNPDYWNRQPGQPVKPDALPFK